MDTGDHGCDFVLSEISDLDMDTSIISELEIFYFIFRFLYKVLVFYFNSFLNY